MTFFTIDDARYGRGHGFGHAPAFANPALTIANTFLALLISMAMICLPIAAHGVHPALGMLMTVGLGAACAARLPQVALMAVLVGFMFQNLFVSLMADLVRSEDDFDIIRAYNFLLVCITWLVLAVQFLGQWKRRDPALNRYVVVTVGVMAVLGVYFLIGLAGAPMVAVIYLRNIVTPLLMFQICIILFSTDRIRFSSAMTTLSVTVIACGFFEFFRREAWLYWTNGHKYWELAMGANWQTLAFDEAVAESGIVNTGLIDSFTIEFLNSPLFSDLDIPMLRLFGPNMHAISFAYCLCFFAIFALFRGRWIQALLLTALVFLCNAKGPMIALILVSAGWVAFRLFGSRFAFLSLSAVLVIYAVVGIAIGLNIGDYHVLGLMAAFYEFPLNPIGYGMGSGGNLSPLFDTINWPEAQAMGRAQFPVESSVGVLLYQLGIFAIGLIGAYVWIAWRVMRIARMTGNNLHAAAALGLLALIANGLFQEEAYFSPLGLAMYLALSGMIIGAAIREGVEQDHDQVTTTA